MPPKTPGQALAAWRKASQLTIADTAAIFRVATSTIWRWETERMQMEGPAQALLALLQDELVLRIAPSILAGSVAQ